MSPDDLARTRMAKHDAARALEHLEAGGVVIGVGPASDVMDCPECHGEQHGIGICGECNGLGFVEADDTDSEGEPMSEDERRVWLVQWYGSPARYLLAKGALYATHMGGDWYEVDATSDGMCGTVRCENPITTEYVGYHWSVTGKLTSEHQAREAARRELVGREHVVERDQQS